jgi:23S rRNA pseudouridine2605 synthase
MHDSDSDDHEPGDVNGNVDPAYAKKLKSQVRPPKVREPRVPRAPRPRPEPVAVPVSASPDLPAVVATQSSGDDAGAPAAGVPGEVHGQQRARGPRRNRRGGRGRNARGERVDRPALAEGADATAATDGQNESGQALPMVAGAGPDDAADNPNPGAFGDPSRPMDRSARRNRNRHDKRGNNRGAREGERGPRAPQFGVAALPVLDADGVPSPLPGYTEGAVISGVNEAGERDGERLHKVLAQQGLGSRRDMEALIEAGEVDVNGVRAHVGQVVNEHDRVHVKRRKVTVKLGDDKPRILIYHKQPGEIVSRDDPEQRDTVFDRLPRPDHGKWVAVGRLDYNSEGLLLFTTYGELANRFMHPRYEILREYSVRVLGELTPEQEDQLMDGIELEDGPARVLSLDRIDRDSDAANHWYRLTLNEGRNREVRRMFEHLGLTVSRLIRTSYGCVQMPSWLKRGQFKQLDEAETFEVLESVGLRSKKKLEKAARFGGRNRIPQQPLGPMRSATEHEAIWTGLPADAGAGGGRGRRQGGRGPGGAGGGQGGRRGIGRGPGGNAPVALQQQQFPGFGGASEMPVAGRRQRTPGNKVRRGPGGEVNGNVAPGYRGPPAAGAGNRRAGNASRGGNRARGGEGGYAGAADGSVVDASLVNGNNAANGPAKRGRRRRGPNSGGARTDSVAAGAATMPDIE